ncbi:hypothetical protein AOA12_07740 [Microbacterium sp. No. 7]|nr:hypothetical protein AOA12_07740 [Microbacterium sp. No. 7]
MLPALVVAMMLGGGALLAAAAVTSIGGLDRAGDPEEPRVATAPTETAAPAPTRTPASASAPVSGIPIAELADPAWTQRIAAAGDIPERAMAAYAGAALAVAGTHPACGLGWNTLAAIGLVETLHGSMHGATLHADGTVLPAIVGIALDGDGTIPVPDTDGGAIDGDAVWDRAVGPMQFIPSTWALAAQDGDRDGVTDINQIDDAVLAAAVHLCEVGGDLTQPENWIAAVSAYNPSLDYNHRVAAAANSYATLE